MIHVLPTAPIAPPAATLASVAPFTASPSVGSDAPVSLPPPTTPQKSVVLGQMPGRKRSVSSPEIGAAAAASSSSSQKPILVKKKAPAQLVLTPSPTIGTEEPIEGQNERARSAGQACRGRRDAHERCSLFVFIHLDSAEPSWDALFAEAVLDWKRRTCQSREPIGDEVEHITRAVAKTFQDACRAHQILQTRKSAPTASHSASPSRSPLEKQTVAMNWLALSQKMETQWTGRMLHWNNEVHGDFDLVSGYEMGEQQQ